MSRSLIKIIGGFIAFIILVIGGFFGVLPLYNAANDRGQEIEAAQFQQQMIRSDLASLQEDQANIANLREQVAVFEVSFPEDHEQQAFIRFLDSIAAEHEVLIKEYSLSTPVQVVDTEGNPIGVKNTESLTGGGLFQSQVVIGIEADYEVLIGYLGDLLRSERAFRVNSISVTDGQERSFVIDGFLYQLAAPIAVEMPEEEEQPPAAP